MSKEPRTVLAATPTSRAIVADGAAAEQVAPAAEQFPGARAGEDEPQAVAAHEGVHLVEEGGQFLDLVHDHRLPLVGQRGTLLCKNAGIGRQPAKLPGGEQVVGRGGREQRPQERALPGLPRAPQEAGITGERGGSQNAADHDNPQRSCVLS